MVLLARSAHRYLFSIAIFLPFCEGFTTLHTTSPLHPHATMSLAFDEFGRPFIIIKVPPTLAARDHIRHPRPLCRCSFRGARRLHLFLTPISCPRRNSLNPRH